jgi:hypothetical protein
LIRGTQLRDTIALRDNETMKHLARVSAQESETMRALTEKTIKEARTVKTITLVTLVYLPASFTSVSMICIITVHRISFFWLLSAPSPPPFSQRRRMSNTSAQTFLGMGFIHVDSQESGSALSLNVSRDLYFYIAITVPLMVATLLVWYLWELRSDRASRRIRARDRKAGSDDEKFGEV